MKIYILTKEYNMYDQQGAYYVACFKDLPTYDQLISFGVERNRIKHTQNGGGRKDRENEWFNLNLVEIL